jgi:hypothetical protein
MAQADSMNSTTAGAVSSRRRFLSQAAGVAAGGTALALATVSATADAAAPVASLAYSDIDPIFALIEEYRTAAQTVTAATSEHSRREDMLIEQGLGLSPFTSLLDVSGPGSAQPMVVYTHEYVDRLIPPDRFGEPNAAAHASLDAQIERHKAILGDSEKVMHAAMDAEREVLDTVVWTSPTTIVGALALLELWSEIRDASLKALDDDQIDTLILSIAGALRDLHPNVTVIA